MFSIETIRNIEKQSFFKKAKEIKNKITSLKHSKIAWYLTQIPVTLGVNYTFYLFALQLIEKTEKIETIMVVVFGFMFFLLFNLVGVLIPFFLQKAFNLILGAENINEAAYFDTALPYNIKKMREIIKNIKSSDKESKALLSRVRKIDINDIQLVTYELLLERTRHIDKSDVINNKNEIIKLAKEKLTNDQQYLIFKEIEKIVIFEKDRKQKIIKLNPEEVLESINKIENTEEKFVMNDKKFIIKNI